MTTPPRRTSRSRRMVVLAALTVAAFGSVAAAPAADGAPGQTKKAPAEAPAGDVSTNGLSWLYTTQGLSWL